MARRGSSPKILEGLAPRPLHVIRNTMSVIKNGKTFQNMGAQPQTGGGGLPPPGPSVEPRLHVAT